MLYLSPKCIGRGLTLISIVLALLNYSACTLKTPPAKSPPPNEQETERGFFEVSTVDENGNPARKGRLFQCAWAPVSEIGMLGEWFLTHGATTTDHCNVVFKITGNKLLGLKVEPSKDQKDWKTIISIPVSHFTRTNEEDEMGRAKKNIANRTDKNHSSRQGNIKVDLSGLQVHEWAYELTAGGAQVLAVEDVEWNEYKGKKYWAFTLTVSDSYFGSYLQAKYRFNFLEFDHDPNFKPTPYHEENSKYLNILHVLGKNFEQDHKAHYAGRWDTSGGDGSIDICLHNFPQKYKKVAVDVVEGWNDAFSAVGQPRIFKVNLDRKLDYSLDLRCPTIYWVSDKRILRNSPLGIGLINTDVQNGKALWGSIIFYGGSYERYAKAYTPSDFAAMMSDEQSHGRRLQQGLLGNPFNLPKQLPYFLSDTKIAQYGSAKFANNFSNAIINEMKGNADLYQDFMSHLSLQDSKERPASFTEAVKQFPEQSEIRKVFSRINIQDYFKMGSNYEKLFYLAAAKNSSDEKRYTQEDAVYLLSQFSQNMQSKLLDIISQDKANLDVQFAKMPLDQLFFGNSAYGDDLNEQNEKQRKFAAELVNLPPDVRAQKVEGMARSEALKYLKSSFWDLDRTFLDVAPEWHSASVSEKTANRPFQERLRAMIKQTMAHEFGHFVGLGHNFKENILPRENSLPKKYYEKALANVKKYGSALTTVMGYDNPNVEVNLEYDDIMPGPYDLSVLRYLYNREYPTWNGSDEDFSYAKLPADGLIPEYNHENESYAATYFPACNDYQASFSLDPYCMRHDYGYDAASIIEGIFDSLDKNWLANVNNYAEVSRSFDLFWWMWSRSFSSFARVRHFYDYMATEYADQIAEIAVKPENLYDFYATCKGEKENPEVAKVLMDPTVNPEFRELCKANGKAIETLSTYLEKQGSDYTEMDHSRRYVVSAITGGDANIGHSRWQGIWTRLGMLSVKIPATITLTSPYPYVYWSSYWMWPVYRFARSGKAYKNLYSTLYPIQFTETVKNTVGKNIQLRNEGASTNSMSREILALGYFLDDQLFSNEVHRGVDPDYLRHVRQQSYFNSIGYVAVVLKGVKRIGDKAEPDRVVSFSANVYDLSTGEKIPVGTGYVLPDAKVIFKLTDQKAFIYTISDVEFYTDDIAVAWGLKVGFSEDDKSSLWTRSAKVELRTKYRDIIDTCLSGTEVSGVRNGLEGYFSAANNEFRGFRVLPGISDGSSDSARFKIFKDSVDEEFKKYWNSSRYAKIDNKPNPRSCKDALEGIGLVVTSSIALQGYWMSELNKYIIH